MWQNAWELVKREKWRFFSAVISFSGIAMLADVPAYTKWVFAIIVGVLLGFWVFVRSLR